jgi:hypothetical protein
MRLLWCSWLLLSVAACGSPELPKKVEWIGATDGEVAPLVAAEVTRAQRSQRTVLVYVGATWCEPCRRFHEAVKSGALDARFGALRLIEFDFDRDNERLKRAGYESRLIPLLALPGSDGRASGKQMEGSIKGDGAVGEITPRLAALLAATR